MIASRQSCMSSVASMTATPGNRRYLYLTVCTGNLLALCGGIPIAWTSPTLPKLLQEGPQNPLGRIITEDEASWIGSLIAIGGILGTYLAGFSAVKFGRKMGLLVSCVVPFISSFLILANATNIYWFYIGRLLSGFAVSGVLTVIPLYHGEIAEDCNRGLICCSMMTFQTGGQLFTFCLGPYLPIYHFCMTTAWLGIVAAVLMLIIMPESPYYLINVNKRDAAMKALIQLRATVGREVSDELNLIGMIVQDAKENQGKMSDIIKSKALRKAQTITISLMIFQNFSGIVPVLFYTETIFRETKTTMPPEICAMAIGLVEFVSSFLTPNLVDRLGRRWMLFISASGMCVSEFFLGLYFYLKDCGRNMELFYWLPVVSLVLYMIFYIIGFGPLVWTVMAEIFPANMKSAAATLTVSLSWILAFVMVRIFQPLSHVIGMAGCFWSFAASCAFAAVFSVTFLIETKGKSFSEIQQLLCA